MLEENSYAYSVLLLLAVFIIKALLVRVMPYEPLQFFTFYCEKLAHKVNKAKNSQQQRVVAGAIAIIITLPILILILWLFADFIAVSWMWESLLLYIALGAPSLSHTSNQVSQALINNNNEEAKSFLSPWVLRDTQPLSSMGLSKASIEMLILRTSQSIIGVSFYFIIGGGLWALTYRLLLEMHYSWNVKQSYFKDFGQVVAQLTHILQWLPCRLFTLILLLSTIGKNSRQCIKASFADYFTLNNNTLLQALACMLNVQLGGVAMYKGIKLRRVAFNAKGRQPQPSDIQSTIKITRLCLVVFGLVLLTTSIVPWIITLPS